MLYSMLAMSENALVESLFVGVIIFCVVALLISFCVGLKRGIRRVSWLGVTWLTSGLSFCILHAKIGDWFAEQLTPLTNVISLKQSAKAFLPPLILASICMLTCLMIHGIVALIIRKKRPTTVSRDADIFVRDDDWIEYDDEAEDYDDFDPYKGKKLVQHIAYSKHGNFGFYTPPMRGDNMEMYPTMAGRVLGGLVCLLNCLMITASVLLCALFVLQATPLRDTALSGLFASPAIQNIVKFTKDYWMDFLMIGIAVAFLLKASKKGFMETLRVLVVYIGGIVLVGFCFYIPFSTLAMHPSKGGTWLFNQIVRACVEAVLSMTGKYAPIIGCLCAGIGMSIMAIIGLVLVNILFKKAIRSIYEFGPFRGLDTILSVLVYFVVALAVCLLFWSVFVIFGRFGLDETMFFTNKSTLSEGFFRVCRAYLQPMISNAKQMVTNFFSSINA